MNIYLYVLDTLADWEIGYITAEVSSGRYLRSKTAKLIRVGATMDPITTMGGMTVQPDMTAGSLSPQRNDVLILPGADVWMRPEHQGIITVAQHMLEQGGTVAAICGATAALAAGGVLNTRRHTSNAVEYLKGVASAYTGESLYDDGAAVLDRNLISASGLAALDFSYQVFRHTGLMAENTAEAWYQLHKTREPEYFHRLMECAAQ